MKTKLRIGADPFPPYQYYDEDGVLRGSDYETVRAAGEKAGFEMEFIIGEWSLIEKKMSAGELDAVFQVQKTPEREERFCFSKLLRKAVTEIITGDEVLALSSCAGIPAGGLTLGVQANYSYGGEVDALDDACKKEYGSGEALLRAVQNREVDAGVFDRGVKNYLMEQKGIQGIRALEELSFDRPLYVAFIDPEIRDAFDAYLPASTD
jgi:ABC-type amino acid transport substrate-binding protein